MSIKRTDIEPGVVVIEADGSDLADLFRATYQPEPITDHEYLSAGDTHAASGDRPYTGCFHCGKSRKRHAR